MRRFLVALSVPVLALLSTTPGCSSDSGPQRRSDAATGGNVPPEGGGQVGSGGTVGTGGQVGSGGSLMTGGTVASGGVAAEGGSVASGGSLATGGTATSGGTMGKGGVMAMGGVAGLGGTQAGGTSATGGTLATGGTATAGGATGSGGVSGSGGDVGAGGAKVDAGSTQGCQCTLNVTWSVSFDCYCDAYPGDCDVNYASYGPDAGPSGRSYTGIKEYAGCNLAVVSDMDSMQDGNKYFDLTTGRLVGLTKTANGGIGCPFGADAGTLVFGFGTGQTTVPTSCDRTACFASSRAPSYCAQ